MKGLYFEKSLYPPMASQIPTTRTPITRTVLPVTSADSHLEATAPACKGQGGNRAGANEEKPREHGASRERMKGLEPSTFCMASRRSSQLSYIRVGRQYSPAF